VELVLFVTTSLHVFECRRSEKKGGRQETLSDIKKYDGES